LTLRVMTPSRASPPRETARTDTIRVYPNKVQAPFSRFRSPGRAASGSVLTLRCLRCLLFETCLHRAGQVLRQRETKETALVSDAPTGQRHDSPGQRPGDRSALPHVRALNGRDRAEEDGRHRRAVLTRVASHRRRRRPGRLRGPSSHRRAQSRRSGGQMGRGDGRATGVEYQPHGM
jgi:hypothetical protein